MALESETPLPLSTQLPNHILLPITLANMLFDCYYGGGPRYQERGPRSIPTPELLPPQAGGGERSELLPLPTINRVPTTWTPRGYAAKRVQEETQRINQNGNRLDESSNRRDSDLSSA